MATEDEDKFSWCERRGFRGLSYIEANGSLWRPLKGKSEKEKKKNPKTRARSICLFTLLPSYHTCPNAFNPFSASQLSTTNFSLYNTYKIWHLVMRKWELIKHSQLLKIKSQILSNLFNEKYGLGLGEFKNTSGSERVNTRENEVRE